MNHMRQTAWSPACRKKPYVTALILAVLLVLEIFFLSGLIGQAFGFMGTVIHEVVMALIAVVVILAARGRMRVAFPFHRLRLAQSAGALILWGGMLLVMNLVTMIMSYLYPTEVVDAGSGVDALVSSMPVWLGVLVVALVPAICEEIAFRGAMMTCFRGARSKWTGIIVVSLFFGACHGSIWRMIPTAILGMAIGYVLFETENIFYCMLMHFVNNAFSVLLSSGLNWLYQQLGEEVQMDTMTRIPLSSVGMAMIYATAAPILIYLGNYLLHRGQPGYDRGMFPPEKKWERNTVIAATVGLLLCGILLVVITIALRVVIGMNAGGFSY